jgi:hypothetical protein
LTKVDFDLNSGKGSLKSNLPKHSSEKLWETNSTPLKSKITKPFDSKRDSICSRISCPRTLVPRC